MSDPLLTPVLQAAELVRGAAAPAPAPVTPDPEAATRAVLRWAIEHYGAGLTHRNRELRLYRPEVSFEAARCRFAEDVLLRDDRTVARWLSGRTAIPPRVARWLHLQQRRARNPRAVRADRRSATLRELFWRATWS